MILRFSRIAAAAAACLAASMAFSTGARTQVVAGDRERLREDHHKCVENLKQVNRAVVRYMIDHDETLPSLKSAEDLQRDLRPYVSDPALFRCPVTGKPYATVAAHSAKPWKRVYTPWIVVLLRDAAPHPGIDWIVQAYADGHVKGVKATARAK